MNTTNTRATLTIYWQHARKYPKYLFGAMITSPLNILLGQFLPPILLANIIQRLATGDYTKGDMLGSFGSQLAIYLTLSLVSVLGWRAVDWFNWRLEMLVSRDIAQRIYSHLLSMSANFHANNFGGSLVSNSSKFIGSYVRIADTITYGVFPMVAAIIFSSVVLTPRAPLLVIVLNGISIVFVGAAILMSRTTRDASSKHAQSESLQTGVLADSVTNVMAIKSYAAQDFEQRRFAEYTNSTGRAFFAWYKTMMIQLSTFSSLTRVMEGAAVLAAIFAVVQRDATFATVYLALTFSSNIADKLFNFSQSSLKNFNRSFGDASVMTEILNTPAEITDPRLPEKAVMETGAIAFNDVTFTHDGSKSPIFSSFNLTIKPGERVGLVGHSGSGKTTLTRLLLRFSDIDSGSIAIDGQDIRNVTQDDLHKHITYVPQEPMLFHRSLAENIGYGKRGASLDEIQKFSKLAHAHEFIKDIPKGYDTLVGERGVKLSGGQRQRVAIARAMIKDAPIVVLDEATSALDSESEVVIQKALWKLMEGRTAIVIAHRLSTIQKMDRIVVMDNGKIIEEGSHAELLKKKGKYAELWAHQSGGFIEA